LKKKSSSLLPNDRFRPMSRYFPIGAEHRLLGVHVFNVGTSCIEPEQPYPLIRNPESSSIDWSKGRMLPSPKLLYITRGEGIIETRTGKHHVLTGDMLCIRPQTWHYYRPDSKTGWDETWFKFEGPLALRLLKHPSFNLDSPILRIGLDREVIRQFDEMVFLAREETTGFELLLASKAIEILSSLIVGGRRKEIEEHPLQAVVREAKERLLDEGGHLSLEELASSLGVSYSTFRRAFKEQTQISPHQFQLQSRIYQSCRLLTETVQPIKEIADHEGFENVSHFSQMFKRKTGWSPLDYRRKFSLPRVSESSLIKGALASLYEHQSG
jgi:AraC-like DNA-binding protein